MKSKLLWLSALFLMFSTAPMISQTGDLQPQKPTKVGTLEYRYVPSIAEQIQNGTFIPSPENFDDKPINERRRHGFEVIPGKGSTGLDPLVPKQEDAKKIPGKMPSLVFTATTNTATPSDPTGAVGRDFYIAAWNTAFQVFNKDGTAAAGMPNAASLATIFGGTIGDPIVFYDSAADRYVVTQFWNSPNGFEVAVSQTNNPVTGGWHIYSASNFTTGAFPDYTKFSIWRDGYYVTANINGGTGQVFAIERDQMLNGDPSTIQAFNLPGFASPIGGFYCPQVFNVMTDDLPTAGGATIVYQQDDAYPGVAPGNDHFKLWTLDIDWATPANSTISAPTEYPVSSFNGVFDGGSFSNLTQPTGGPDIDALQALIANQANFRKFATYNSAVFCHVVDVGSGTEQAAIRWYEMRQTADGQPWTLHQEGTYISPDGKHAWNGSMAMDNLGNIGLGFTSMGQPGSGELITSRYTGQLVGAAPGVMNVAEEVILASTGINGSLRYADYSQISVDPDNDQDFWFINELFGAGNVRQDVVGVFKLAPDTNNDVGVISVDAPVSASGLTNAETVTVTLFNFGLNDASNFDVNFQIDGGSVITETFTGTIPSAGSAQYSFTATGDFSSVGTTYSVTACTALAGDENTANDCTSANVTNISPNDVGVIDITSPVTGEGLGNETVTVTIENFGGVDQTGFDVQYSVDGGTPVVETFNGTVTAGGTSSFTFATTADLSTVGTYNIIATTLLAGDADNSNDSFAVDVTNVACVSQSDAPGSPVGPNAGTVTTSTVTFTDDFVVEDVNVTLNITHTWNADLDVRLIAPDGTTSIVLFQDVGGSSDNFVNCVLDDEAATPIANGTGPFTGSFIPAEPLSTFNGLQSIGDWTLEITDDANQDGGTLNDWNLQLCGNTNLSVDDPLVDEDLIIVYEENNHFLIKLPTTTVTEMLDLHVYNSLGQTIYFRTLENENGTGYEYRLNMSYMSAGVYFVKIGDGVRSNMKRIIVR